MKSSTDNYINDDPVIRSDDLLRKTIHEFNNSLTTILGFTQMVMHSEQLDCCLKEYMNTIYEAAIHSKNIIDEIDTTKINEDKCLKFDVSINELVESALRLASIKCKESATSKDVAIKFIINLKSRKTIHVNPTEIRQVILNILLNALDSFDQDGEINIETQDFNDETILKISDTGIGMEKETIKHLFDPYFTTKGSKGTGLGLPICKSIIEKYNGKIEVESKHKVGTIFTIHFKTYN